MERAEPIAVYVHTPFCPTKCGYCDFNSFALQGAIHEQTVRAIIREIECSPLRGRPAKTIFFGGGTPTYLKASQLGRLLEAVVAAHPPLENCEITSEANPGTVDIPKFAAMRAMGFNRITMGAQSFVDSDLERLGRVHRSGDIERAFRAAREAGFDNTNLDLMFALPGQNQEAWRENLDRAIGLGPEHLSLYCLTLEPNTPFYKEHLRGALVLPDDDEQVAMYEAAISCSAQAGYLQYEISNFAKPGRECRHNLAYWRYEEYAGYGPGAVGCFDCGLGIADCGLGTEDRGFGIADCGLGTEDRGFGIADCGLGTEDCRLGIGDCGLGEGQREKWTKGPKGGARIRYTNLKHPARYSQVALTLALFTDSQTLSRGEAGSSSDSPPLREGQGRVAARHDQSPILKPTAIHPPTPSFKEGEVAKPLTMTLPQGGREISETPRLSDSSTHRLTGSSVGRSFVPSSLCPSPLWCEWEPLDAEKERLERIMLGIRLNEGLPIASLCLSESEISNLKSQIGKLEAKGWVEGAGDGVIRLTPEGRHWCSEVALALA